ncbi:MAG: hypothetical protein PUB22_01745 [Clostridiales bacterium]|nr:hypothetical protein [Clostridiales bacterium]
MRNKAVLKGVENDGDINWNTAPDFLMEYQRAILLILRENEILNEDQYRMAEDKLRKRIWKRD